MTSRFQWAAVAAGLALTLGGCQTLAQSPPPTDPAFVAALSKTKNDGAPLFAGLLASTNCNATGGITGLHFTNILLSVNRVNLHTIHFLNSSFNL